MTNYRKTLYTNYFTNQAGRDHTAKLKQKFDDESEQFKNEMIRFLPENKLSRILDVGCGTGSFIHACKEAGYKNVTGVDISEEMVLIAHTFGVDEAVQGELNQFLEGKNQQFNVISGMDIIEHFTKDELLDLILKIKDGLMPDGMVIFRTPNTDAPFGTMFSNGDFTHENFLNKNSITQVMMAMGFEQVKVYPSHLQVKGVIKEMFRKLLWQLLLFRFKLELFASGRSTGNIIFTPNIIVVASLKE